MKKEHLEVLLEDIRDKFDLVLEAHEILHKAIKDTRLELREEINVVNVRIDALNQKIDTVDKKLTEQIEDVEKRLTEKIDNVRSELSEKIDNVAVDLAAHRADTETHRPIYKVRE